MINCKTPTRLINPNALVSSNNYLDPTKSKWYINGELIQVTAETGIATVVGLTQAPFIGASQAQWITDFSKVIELEFKVMNEGITKQVYLDLLMNKFTDPYLLEVEIGNEYKIQFENMGLSQGSGNSWTKVNAKLDREGNVIEPAHILLTIGFVDLSIDEWEK